MALALRLEVFAGAAERVRRRMRAGRDTKGQDTNRQCERTTDLDALRRNDWEIRARAPMPARQARWRQCTKQPPGA